MDLRITNMTEYRGWQPLWNGVKLREEVGKGFYTSRSNGSSFNVINLLAPRDPTQSRHWSSELTMVQLKYEFLTGAQHQQVPITLDRVYLTFYDFDAGDSAIMHESMQIDPQVRRPPTASLVQYTTPHCRTPALRRRPQPQPTF